VRGGRPGGRRALTSLVPDRTIGRYFADAVAAPLGLAFSIGLPDAVAADRVAVLQARHYVAKAADHPQDAGAVRARLPQPRSITARTFSNPKVLGQPARCNDREIRPREIRLREAASECARRSA
jgi:hypothetical protein